MDFSSRDRLWSDAAGNVTTEIRYDATSATTRQVHQVLAQRLINLSFHQLLSIHVAVCNYSDVPAVR